MSLSPPLRLKTLAETGNLQEIRQLQGERSSPDQRESRVDGLAAAVKGVGPEK
jgi:hypothetical protein